MVVLDLLSKPAETHVIWQLQYCFTWDCYVSLEFSVQSGIDQGTYFISKEWNVYLLIL